MLMLDHTMAGRLQPLGEPPWPDKGGVAAPWLLIAVELQIHQSRNFQVEKMEQNPTKNIPPKQIGKDEYLSKPIEGVGFEIEDGNS